MHLNRLYNLPANTGLAYNVSIFKRNLILSSTQQLRETVYNTNDTAIQNKYNGWIDYKEQLAFWYTKPVIERPANLKSLENSADSYEKELTRLLSVLKRDEPGKEVRWKNIQQALKSNEAAIEFVNFTDSSDTELTQNNYYMALILRRDKSAPELVKLFEKKKLDELLRRQGSDAHENINKRYTKGQIQSIYDIIWQPVEKYLGGITKIYFAPAGDLHQIAFSALPVNDKQVLSDTYQLVQLNTTIAITGNAQNYISPVDKLQLYGGIHYDADSSSLSDAVIPYKSNDLAERSLPGDLDRGAGFQFLDGARKETEEIKKQADDAGITASLLSGSNAVEESFKALNGKASPSILHIATHGFFFPDPKNDERNEFLKSLEKSGKPFRQSDNPLFRSGLAFAGANNAWKGKPIDGIEDGILTAYEVSNMYFPDTKLVVLSACETALGDIQGSEGVYGLQRVFKMAGVQNLVMSLWKVPDAETAEFMQLFYKNLFAKQAISDAFYNAQKEMKNQYRNEPYKWAAWILVR